jgi:hypothetical protein
MRDKTRSLTTVSRVDASAASASFSNRDGDECETKITFSALAALKTNRKKLQNIVQKACDFPSLRRLWWLASSWTQEIYYTAALRWRLAPLQTKEISYSARARATLRNLEPQKLTQPRERLFSHQHEHFPSNRARGHYDALRTNHDWLN